MDRIKMVGLKFPAVILVQVGLEEGRKTNHNNDFLLISLSKKKERMK